MVKRILIGLLVLAVAATAFFVLRKQRAEEGRSARAGSRFVLFDDREVTSLEIVNRESQWELGRANGAWEIRTPVRDATDSMALGRLFSGLRHAVVTRTLETPESLDSYGLDPAAAEIVLGGVEAPRILLGDVVPTRDGVFARLEGRSGVLVLQMMVDAYRFAVNPALLRQRSVLGVSASTVQRVEVEVAGATRALEYEEDGWWLVEPGRVPASDDVVAALLSALGEVEVAGFLDGADPADPALGLGSGSPEIVVYAGEATRTIRLGAKREGGLRVVLREDRPSPLLVPGEGLEGVPPAEGSFLGTRLTRVNRYEVTWFRYGAEGDVVEARRQGENGWVSGEDPVPDETVYLLLARLLEMRGTWSAGPAPKGAAPVAATLEFETETGGTGRITYTSGGDAFVDSIPGAVFRGSSPPAVPSIP